MATKNISITEDAYSRLAGLRQTNESFSDIINRITHKTRLSRFSGVLSKESSDTLEKHFRKLRSGYRKNASSRIKSLRKQLG